MSQADLFGDGPPNKREDELRRLAEPWIVEHAEHEPRRRAFIEAFIEDSRPRRYPDGR